MKSKALLTILISTYNREELLLENLKKTLSSIDDRACFVICDNASTDNTWHKLESIKDERAIIYRNERNLDIWNYYYMVSRVSTPFFLFLNDRDCIEPDALSDLLDFIFDHCDFDIIASFKGGMFLKEGEKKDVEFFDVFHQANHPGHMIYNTDFWNKNINQNELNDLIVSGDYVKANQYVSFKLMNNISKGIYRRKNHITQPINRDKTVAQKRREVYGKGTAYILPEHQIDYFDSCSKYLSDEKVSYKTNEYLLSYYRNGIEKIEHEFFGSVRSYDFCVRNNCVGQKPYKWVSNGMKYTSAVLNNSYVKNNKMRMKVVFWFIKSLLLNSIRNVACYFI